MGYESVSPDCIEGFSALMCSCHVKNYAEQEYEYIHICIPPLCVLFYCKSDAICYIFIFFIALYHLLLHL